MRGGHHLLMRTWPGIALGAAYLFIVVWVSPRYEVPQNDDWAYFQTLQIWAQTGELRHLGWNDPTLVFQAMWGRILASAFGLNYTSLRLSTLILSWVGVMSLFGILRHLGVGRAMSLVGSGVMLFNPVYLTLSYSFNTDVPYVALATAATWLFLRALDRDSMRGFVATGTLLACSYLVRQQALGIAVVAAIFLVFGWRAGGANREHWKRRIGAIAGTVGPTLAAAIAYRWWVQSAAIGPWTPQLTSLPLVLTEPSFEVVTDTLFQVVHEGSGILLNLGLLLFPLAVVGLGAGLAPFRGNRFLRRCLPISLGLTAAFAIWLTVDLSGLPLVGDYLRGQPEKFGPPRGWPYVGNYLTRGGSLPQLTATMYLPSHAWQCFTLVAPLLAAWFLTTFMRAIGEARRDAAGRNTALVIAFGLAQFLPSLLLATVYDRYFLVALPAAVVVGCRWGAVGQKGIAAGFLALLILAAGAAEWTRAYVERSRARWEVAEELMARGVLAAEINAGFEWAGEHLYLEAVRSLGVGPPYDLEAGYPWDPLVTNRYVVFEWRNEPLQATAVGRSYRGFMSRESRWIGVIKR
jgi:hypothetical protein